MRDSSTAIAVFAVTLIGAGIGGLINLGFCTPSNFWLGALYGAGTAVVLMLGGADDLADIFD